ncbi:ABC transporter substrate-binding protein [Nocardia bovistercoris]|uniref:ABC transporter substrate-binding protein n=1 Tax=Nocardia bovistercoris TaxID=2785916 RepID=A0A931II51_9NOCA|nr:ABC transporter substrate-binding protein [Nocardia bovistercoris]MBH0781018.1 ABC transporter substrate-binding protein [Nocardia bovistercoris]
MSSTIVKLRYAAIGTTLVLALAGCGDNSDEGSAGGANTFTGAPVTVMTLAPVKSAAMNTPEIITAAEAAVKTINAAGGLGGHEVKLLACNDGNNANQAGDCARQAVSANAVAVLGGFTTNGGTVVPILEKAGIPWIGSPALSAEELSSKVAYPLVSGAAAFAGIGARAAADGCASTSMVLYDVPPSEKAAQLINLGLARGNGKPADHIKVPTTTTDFSSIAKTAGKSDCAIVGLPNDQVVALATAARTLGEKTRYYALQGALNDQVLSGARDALEGATSAVNFVAATDPAWQGAKTASTKVDWTYPYNQNTWAAYQVLIEAVGGASDISAASVTAALDKMTAAKAGGLTAPIDFSKEFPVPGINRVFNPNITFVKAKGGAVVQDGGFENLTPLFAG